MVCSCLYIYASYYIYTHTYIIYVYKRAVYKKENELSKVQKQIKTKILFLYVPTYKEQRFKKLITLKNQLRHTKK